MDKQVLQQMVGERIRNYRILKGWTQEQLSEALGTQSPYIGRIERGEQNIQLSTLGKIAGALQVSVHSLFMEQQIEEDKWLIRINLLLREHSDEHERAYRVLYEMLKDR